MADEASPFDRLLAAIKAVELPEGYGVAILGWNQDTGRVDFDSTLPDAHLVSFLRAWDKMIGVEPAEVHHRPLQTN